MPQIKLEYSANIGAINQQKFFSGLHDILSEISDPNSCKSRSLCFDDYYVGNNHQANAFIYLKISLLPGRDEQILKRLGEACLEYLQIYFKETIEEKQLCCEPRLEITELKHYFC